LQFRYRGSRRESAVAQLSTLGHITHHTYMKKTNKLNIAIKTSAVIAGLLFLYLASGGPVVYCINKKGLLPTPVYRVLNVAYIPTGVFYDHCGLYQDYLDWCGRKAKPL
jgi:hypothetical protein